MSDRAEQFKALTVKQHIAQTEVDRIGAARAMLLASWHAETGLSYAKIGVEVDLKRATVQQLVERGREIMKPTTYTIIASTGAEVDYDNPTPRWGYTHGDDAFLDEIEYQDGDTIERAVTRCQEAGKLPAGEVTVERGERLDDYWIHEDHQRAYTVTITPNPGNIVSVAMGDTLPEVDAYADEHGLTRAAALRHLVDIGLNPTEILVWSLMCGESPTSHAVEPGIADIEVPDVVFDWAVQHGLDPEDPDPDMYFLVAPEDEAGEVLNEIASTTLAASRQDVDQVREMLEAQRQQQEESRA